MKGFDLGFSFAIDDRKARKQLRDLEGGLLGMSRAFDAVTGGARQSTRMFERISRTGRGAKGDLDSLGAGFKSVGAAAVAALGPFGMIFTVIGQVVGSVTGLYDSIDAVLYRMEDFVKYFGEARSASQSLAFQLQAAGKSMEANFGSTATSWASAKETLEDTIKTTGQGALSIVGLTTSLSKAGMTFNDTTESGRILQQQTQELIKTGSELATVFGEDVATMTDFLSATKGFGYAARDVKKLGGSMVKLQKQFNISGLGEELPALFLDTRKNAIDLGRTFDKDTSVSMIKDTAQIGAAIQKQLGGSIKESINSAKGFGGALSGIASNFEDVQTGVAKTFSQESLNLREILSRARVGEGQLTKLMQNASEHQSEILQLAVKAYNDAGGETTFAGKRIRKLLASINKDVAASLAQGGKSLADALARSSDTVVDSGAEIDAALEKITDSAAAATSIKRNMVYVTGALSITDEVLNNITSGSKGMSKLLDMLARKFIGIQKGAKNSSPALAKFAEVVNTTRLGMGPLAGPSGIMATFIAGFQDQFEDMFSTIFDQGLTFEQRIQKLMAILGKGMRKTLKMMTFGLSEEIWKFINDKDAVERIDKFFIGISSAVETFKPRMQAAWDTIAKVAGPILSKAWKKLVTLLEPVGVEIKMWAAELGGQLLDRFTKMGQDAVDALSDKIVATDWEMVGLDLLIGLGKALDKALGVAFGDTWKNFKKSVNHYVADEDWSQALLEGLKPLAALGLDNIGTEIQKKLKDSLPARVYEYLFNEEAEKAAKAKQASYESAVSTYSDKANKAAMLRASYLNKATAAGGDRNSAIMLARQYGVNAKTGEDTTDQLEMALRSIEQLQSSGMPEKDVNAAIREDMAARLRGFAQTATTPVGPSASQRNLQAAAMRASMDDQSATASASSANSDSNYPGPVGGPRQPPVSIIGKLEVFPRDLSNFFQVKLNQTAAAQGRLP